MNKVAIFTICAKNFIPYALSLQESINRYEPNTDFFIFLADEPDDNIELENIIYLNENWIKEYKKMAFLYDIIEFSTSIKPFCFKYLFNKDYENVIYFDPDILIFNTLTYIKETLINFDIILTPHVCNLGKDAHFIFKDEWYLRVGVFNLGFVAIKNSVIGNQIIDWWCYHLENKCFNNSDNDEATFVDQKWMIFIPASFPNNCKVTNHLGLNMAYWNLHAREIIKKNNQYFVSSKIDKIKIEYPLIFYHFSHYDMQNPTYLIRNEPRYLLKQFGYLEEIYSIYYTNVLNKNFEHYKKFLYSYNYFTNGQIILSLHRRLFKNYAENYAENPFDTNHSFYNLLRKNKLLLKPNLNNKIELNPYKNVLKSKKRVRYKLVEFGLKIIKNIFGIEMVIKNFIPLMKKLSKLENYIFLINKKQ